MSVVGLRTVLRYNHLGPIYEWYFRYSPVLQDNVNLLQWRCIIDVMAEEVNSYLYCSTWFVGARRIVTLYIQGRAILFGWSYRK